MRIILFFILSGVFAQFIYVDGYSIYEVDNYTKFDRFTKHGGWNNYDKSSKDEIKLPSNFPILGNTFTLEALFYSGDSTSDYHQKIIGNLIFNGNQYGNSSPHITFIRNDDIYKIGITDNLLRRFNQLKPDEVLNVVRCSNFESLEKELHKKFKEYRIPQTEYFRLSKNQIEKVNIEMTKGADF